MKMVKDIFRSFPVSFHPLTATSQPQAQAGEMSLFGFGN
jgi:hypothetical protein